LSGIVQRASSEIGLAAIASNRNASSGGSGAAPVAVPIGSRRRD
jgi:hypothetical protein